MSGNETAAMVHDSAGGWVPCKSKHCAGVDDVERKARLMGEWRPVFDECMRREVKACGMTPAWAAKAGSDRCCHEYTPEGWRVEEAETEATHSTEMAVWEVIVNEPTTQGVMWWWHAAGHPQVMEKPLTDEPVEMVFAREAARRIAEAATEGWEYRLTSE